MEIKAFESVFKSLTEGEMAELSKISAIKDVPKGQLVLQPNCTSQWLYLVIAGALKQYYLKEEKEIVFRLILENEFCCSAYGLITAKPAFEYIQAVENTKLLQIDYPKLSALYQRSISLANLGRTITETYFVKEQERVLGLLFKSPRERYCELQATQPALLLRFPLGAIASYLGMTQETLSRLRAERI
jgi:CRP-like cAMP-binding protein